MAATLTLLTSGTAASVSSQATASISPVANRPVFVRVASVIGGGSAPTAPTISGAGLTWAICNDGSTDANVTFTDGVTETGRQVIWRGAHASPSSGALTIDFSAQSQFGVTWEVFDGEDCDSVVQVDVNNGTGTTASGTLSAFGSGSNLGFVCSATAVATPTYTPEAGWTGFTQLNGTDVRSRSAWRTGEDTSPSLTLDSANWGLIALEIEATTASGPTIDTQPTAQTAILAGPWASTTKQFTVAATTSGGSLSYQWQEDDGGGFANISNGGIYGGATSATLTLTGVGAGEDGYFYRCNVTDDNGTTATSSATLTVLAGETLTQPTGTTNASGQFDTDGSLVSDDVSHPFTIVRATCEGVTKDVTVVKAAP